ncbi:MAG: hypothetical protein QW272_05145 [Candidatus Methanomethylicaceae archaeon]
MNKKKLGISSLSLILLVIMAIIGFEIMLIVFTKMSAIDINEVRMEAEKGNELIRIYISIDEYKKGHPDEEETRITINNEWGKTSIIDYFTVEDWDGNIISKGNFTPPIILGAGEIRVYKGDDILNTFKLNNENYKKFWFFFDHIRSINLHTVFGNTFGSCYTHVGEFTITQEKIIIRPTLITFNQTITTTYYNTYALIVESHGPFNFYHGDDDPKHYLIKQEEIYSQYPNVYMWEVLEGWSYEYPDAITSTHNDGWYYYPRGLLVKVETHGRVFGSGYKYWVWWDGAAYIPSQGWFTGIGLYIDHQELWELDQFGREVKLINSTNSESITFPMFGNYKLKRYFRADVSQYIPPPPPPTTTATTTGEQPIPKVTITHFWRSEGITKTKTVKIIPLDTQRWYVKYDYYELKGDTQYVEDIKYDVYPESGKGAELDITITLTFKPDTPSTAHVEVWTHYSEIPY